VTSFLGFRRFLTGGFLFSGWFLGGDLSGNLLGSWSLGCWLLSGFLGGWSFGGWLSVDYKNIL
jgi:hypothetical protein